MRVVTSLEMHGRKWLAHSASPNFQYVKDSRTTAMDVATGFGGLCIRYAKDIAQIHGHLNYERVVRIKGVLIARWRIKFSESLASSFKMAHSMHRWTRLFFYGVGVSETVLDENICRSRFKEPD